jgi:tetratricopeptide (TPR) repeat protein
MTNLSGPHLDPLGLARLLRAEGRRDPSQLHRFVRHLVAGCGPCIESLRQLTDTENFEDELESLEECPEDERPEDERSVNDRATDARFSAALSESGVLERTSRTAADERRAYDEERRRATVDSRAARETPGETRASCELLLGQAARIWSQSPDHATALLQLALEISGGLDEKRYGAAHVADLQARILASLGNVRRIVEDFAEADLWLTKALERLREGSGEPMARAPVHSLLASLRRDQQRFHEARAVLENLIETYLRSGDRHLAGRAMINLATVAQDQAEPERALGLLKSARELLDFEAEPRLELIVLHNMVSLLAENPERASEARRQLAASRHLYEAHGDSVFESRLPWVEGKIALALGELEDAEALLRRACDALLKSSSPQTWAQASLDLVALLMRQMRFSEIEEVAEGILEAFVSRGLHRSTIATLLLLVQAAQARKVTTEMLESTALALRLAPRTGNVPVA